MLSESVGALTVPATVPYAVSKWHWRWVFNWFGLTKTKEPEPARQVVEKLSEPVPDHKYRIRSYLSDCGEVLWQLEKKTTRGVWESLSFLGTKSEAPSNTGP